jgi:hypothetical protein
VRARPSGVHKRLTVDADSRTAPAAPGWLRRHSRLAISAAALAVLAGLLAVTLASGGNDDAGPANQKPSSGSTPESRLLKVIPASVKEAGCERPQGDDFWMGENHGALVQNDCQLPSGVSVPDGEVAYGLFSGPAEAQECVEKDYRFGLRQDDAPRPCSDEQAAQLEVIDWSYGGSAVAAQLYFDPGTDVDAAVAARAELL